MLKTSRMLIALVATTMTLPIARAQDMGKNEGQKKDPPVADTPKSDPGKSDDPKPKPLVKTLAFDKIEGWKVEKSGGMMRAKYEAPAADGDKEGAEIFVIFVGPKGTFEKELDFWASHAVDKDGKKFDKSAIKQDGFEVAGFKIRTGELSGIATRVAKPRKSEAGDKDDKKDDGKGEKPESASKADHKLLACYVEGPDGVWVVKMTGAEKSFDKARDDFLKFVKTIHVVEKAPEEPRKTEKRHKKDDDDD